MRVSSFLFSLVVFHCISLTVSKAEEIRVLCYNIHYGQGTDGVYDVARLAEVIKKVRPDLVALQEVDVGVKRSGRVHQLRELAKLTGLQARYGPTQHYEGGLFGNAVLSRFPILDVVIHPLPYTESTKERVTYPRGCIVVTVRSESGKKVRFVSTHFQHNVPEDRVAEAKAINKLLADSQPEVVTILAGDMNAKPNEEPVNILQKVWKNTMNDPPKPTAPSKKPRVRIDYVFYRATDPVTLVESFVIDEPLASDHCPVFAVLKLTAKDKD